MKTRVIFFAMWVGFAMPTLACDYKGTINFHVSRPCADETLELIKRLDLCNHFAGEDAYDAERAAFLEKATAELKCNELVCLPSIARKDQQAIIDAFGTRLYGSAKAFREAVPLCNTHTD